MAQEAAIDLAPFGKTIWEAKDFLIEHLRRSKRVASLEKVIDDVCLRRNDRTGVRAEAMRRENILLRQENDILKKAAVILGTRLPANSAK